MNRENHFLLRESGSGGGSPVESRETDGSESADEGETLSKRTQKKAANSNRNMNKVDPIRRISLRMSCEGSFRFRRAARVSFIATESCHWMNENQTIPDPAGSQDRTYPSGMHGAPRKRPVAHRLEMGGSSNGIDEEVKSYNIYETNRQPSPNPGWLPSDGGFVRIPRVSRMAAFRQKKHAKD